MEKRDIHGVVFDMDGLMFDSERIVKYSWDVAGERMGYGKLGDNIFYTLGFNVDKRKRHFQDTYGEDFPLNSSGRSTERHSGNTRRRTACLQRKVCMSCWMCWQKRISLCSGDLLQP